MWQEVNNKQREVQEDEESPLQEDHVNVTNLKRKRNTLLQGGVVLWGCWGDYLHGDHGGPGDFGPGSSIDHDRFGMTLILMETYITLTM